VIGAISHSGRGGVSTKKVKEAFQKKAVEMGGNAVFVKDGNAKWGYVIHASNAVYTGTFPGKDELLSKEALAFEGYKPVGKPTENSMAGGAPLTFKTEGRSCYAVAIALDTEARIEGQAREALYAKTKASDKLMSNYSIQGKETFTSPEGFELVAASNGKLIFIRTLAGTIGCASNDGTVAIELQTKGQKRTLGTGKYWVQIYEKKISRAELKKKLKDREEALARQKIEAARAQAQYEREEAQRKAREAQRARLEREQRQQRANQRSNQASNSGPQTFSLSLKNNCSRTVKLFVGDKPKWGSGTYTASPGSQSIQITSGCGGFARE
jgi:hypothetical protein